MQIFYTSYVHIYIFFTILFYLSLDNDRSAVETSCFTVDFYYLGVAAKYRNAVSSYDLQLGSNARA